MVLDEWLQLQNRKIRANCEVIMLPCAYHISTDAKIKNFIPMIGMRQAPSEDRTIPRVCCSPTLMHSIMGYAAVEHEIYSGWFEGKSPVFHIYRFGFNEYVKPNKKVVFDAEATGEVWVVPNCPETTYFKAPIVGEFTLSKSEVRYEHGKIDATIVYIGVTKEPVEIAPGEFVKGGFELTMYSTEYVKEKAFVNQFELKSVKQVPPSAYKNAHKSTNKNIK